MNQSENCFHSSKPKFSPKRKIWKAQSTLSKLTELEEFSLSEKMGSDAI